MTEVFYKQPTESWISPINTFDNATRDIVLREGTRFESVQDGYICIFYFYNECWYLMEVIEE